MSGIDKAKAKVEEMTGAAKEKISDATDNEGLQADGMKDQVGGRTRQAAEDVRQAGDDITR